MKARAYVRVAKGRSGKPIVTATARASAEPLKDPRGRALPTVAFAVELEIPDALFARAEEVIATMIIPEDAAIIAAEVKPRR